MNASSSSSAKSVSRNRAIDPHNTSKSSNPTRPFYSIDTTTPSKPSRSAIASNYDKDNTQTTTTTSLYSPSSSLATTLSSGSTVPDDDKDEFQTVALTSPSVPVRSYVDRNTSSSSSTVNATTASSSVHLSPDWYRSSSLYVTSLPSARDDHPNRSIIDGRPTYYRFNLPAYIRGEQSEVATQMDRPEGEDFTSNLCSLIVKNMNLLSSYHHRSVKEIPVDVLEETDDVLVTFLYGYYHESMFTLLVGPSGKYLVILHKWGRYDHHLHHRKSVFTSIASAHATRTYRNYAIEHAVRVPIDSAITLLFPTEKVRLYFLGQRFIPSSDELQIRSWSENLDRFLLPSSAESEATEACSTHVSSTGSSMTIVETTNHPSQRSSTNAPNVTITSLSPVDNNDTRNRRNPNTVDASTVGTNFETVPSSSSSVSTVPSPPISTDSTTKNGVLTTVPELSTEIPSLASDWYRSSLYIVSNDQYTFHRRRNRSRTYCLDLIPCIYEEEENNPCVATEINCLPPNAVDFTSTLCRMIRTNIETVARFHATNAMTVTSPLINPTDDVYLTFFHGFVNKTSFSFIITPSGKYLTIMHKWGKNNRNSIIGKMAHTLSARFSLFDDKSLLKVPIDTDLTLVFSNRPPPWYAPRTKLGGSFSKEDRFRILYRYVSWSPSPPTPPTGGGEEIVSNGGSASSSSSSMITDHPFPSVSASSIDNSLYREKDTNRNRSKTSPATGTPDIVHTVTNSIVIDPDNDNHDNDKNDALSRRTVLDPSSHPSAVRNNRKRCFITPSSSTASTTGSRSFDADDEGTTNERPETTLANDRSSSPAKPHCKVPNRSSTSSSSDTSTVSSTATTTPAVRASAVRTVVTLDDPSSLTVGSILSPHVGETCTVCYDILGITSDIGLLPCKHRYCFSCISAWTKSITNHCCLCKTSFCTIIRLQQMSYRAAQRYRTSLSRDLRDATTILINDPTAIVDVIIGKETIRPYRKSTHPSIDKEEVTKKKRTKAEKEEDNDTNDADDDEHPPLMNDHPRYAVPYDDDTGPAAPVEGMAKDWNCVQCGKDNQERRLLLCDGCDNAWHTYCLPIPLRRVPDGLWICHDCQNDWERYPAQYPVRTKAEFVQIRQQTLDAQRRANAAKAAATVPKENVTSGKNEGTTTILTDADGSENSSSSSFASSSLSSSSSSYHPPVPHHPSSVRNGDNNVTERISSDDYHGSMNRKSTSDTSTIASSDGGDYPSFISRPSSATTTVLSSSSSSSSSSTSPVTSFTTTSGTLPNSSSTIPSLPSSASTVYNPSIVISTTQTRSNYAGTASLPMMNTVVSNGILPPPPVTNTSTGSTNQSGTTSFSIVSVTTTMTISTSQPFGSVSLYELLQQLRQNK